MWFFRPKIEAKFFDGKANKINSIGKKFTNNAIRSYNFDVIDKARKSFGENLLKGV